MRDARNGRDGVLWGTLSTVATVATVAERRKPGWHFAIPDSKGSPILGHIILAKGVSDSRPPMLRNGAPGIDKKAFAERVATE